MFKASSYLNSCDQVIMIDMNLRIWETSPQRRRKGRSEVGRKPFVRERRLLKIKELSLELKELSYPWQQLYMYLNVATTWTAVVMIDTNLRIWETSPQHRGPIGGRQKAVRKGAVAAENLGAAKLLELRNDSELGGQ